MIRLSGQEPERRHRDRVHRRPARREAARGAVGRRARRSATTPHPKILRRHAARRSTPRWLEEELDELERLVDDGDDARARRALCPDRSTRRAPGECCSTLARRPLALARRSQQPSATCGRGARRDVRSCSQGRGHGDHAASLSHDEYAGRDREAASVVLAAGRSALLRHRHRGRTWPARCGGAQGRELRRTSSTASSDRLADELSRPLDRDVAPTAPARRGFRRVADAGGSVDSVGQTAAVEPRRSRWSHAAHAIDGRLYGLRLDRSSARGPCDVDRDAVAYARLPASRAGRFVRVEPSTGRRRRTAPGRARRADPGGILDDLNPEQRRAAEAVRGPGLHPRRRGVREDDDDHAPDREPGRDRRRSRRRRSSPSRSPTRRPARCAARLERLGVTRRARAHVPLRRARPASPLRARRRSGGSSPRRR